MIKGIIQTTKAKLASRRFARTEPDLVVNVRREDEHWQWFAHRGDQLVAQGPDSGFRCMHDAADAAGDVLARGFDVGFVYQDRA